MGNIPVRHRFYSISGPRGSGKTSIFKEVRRFFRENCPALPVAFLPHILGTRAHPLEWTPDQHKIHTTTRLFYGWARLNEACFEVRKQLEYGNIVFVDEFGLDVYLEANACKDCQQQKDEAFQLHHHHLVPARIVTQGIRPPIYFIPRMRAGTVAGKDTKGFHSEMEHEINRYFSGTGQNPPLFLEGGTVAECALEIVEYVLKRM